MFTKLPIDCLTDNIAERLKFSSDEQLFDNIMHENNPRNDDFDDLPLDGDGRLISEWRIYCVNNDIVFRLNNGSIVEIYTNQM